MSNEGPGFLGLAEWYREHLKRSPDPWAPIRLYLRDFHGINRWDLCDNDSPAWDVFRVVFGLTPADLVELRPSVLGYLCGFLYRMRIANTEMAEEEVLKDIAVFRDEVTAIPNPDAEVRIILKALKKFPAPAQAPPIICSQAEIARFLGQSPNTTKLLETLTQQGIIRFEKGERKKFKVWFTDPERHAEALAKIPKGGRS